MGMLMMPVKKHQIIITRLIVVTEFTGIKSSIFNAIHIIDYLIKCLYQLQGGFFNKANYPTIPTRCKTSEIV